ncbi:N-acetylmuramic acid 6-phosphate etherase [Daejeonella rubra]|uniref:N-acetylmuramic acid 6-phosphate etherase n=1 Tax=Daejeonella rubra TaxID=990371 RepID=A0A1G9S413_9SPHI|nr:N-acetylmuramic acid 6-phosphate etherase [Daejeonella rubra]SDM30047.1 N-acetylmuramic acid 6-phosphate etherase [Daejeonella rubra]
MTRITEQASNYRHLEKMSVEELTKNLNKEDQSVPLAIEKALPQLNTLINSIVSKIENGGRLFYVGAGSGGRLSVLDVIELPTTFGVSSDLFNVILAGGKEHLIEAPEEKEDDVNAAWMMLQEKNVSAKDIVIGISASGTTPFVLSALTECKKHQISTACIVSNPDSPIAEQADIPVEVITGPEFITGSTRMKCGTAQKIIFDMISTTTMIKLGRVLDNQMVNVKLINDKIVDRAVKMLMKNTGLEDYNQAKELLLEHGSVKKALDMFNMEK